MSTKKQAVAYGVNTGDRLYLVCQGIQGVVLWEQVEINQPCRISEVDGVVADVRELGDAARQSNRVG